MKVTENQLRARLRQVRDQQHLWTSRRALASGLANPRQREKESDRATQALKNLRAEEFSLMKELGDYREDVTYLAPGETKGLNFRWRSGKNTFLFGKGADRCLPRKSSKRR